jgi:hypothetical protein
LITRKEFRQAVIALGFEVPRAEVCAPASQACVRHAACDTRAAHTHTHTHTHT